MQVAFERARAALDFLEHHRLHPSPAHYAFALAHLDDPGSDLSRGIYAHTDGGLRLTADAVAALAARHLSPDREAAVDRRERTVAGQAAELGVLSSDAHQVTSALERDVGAIVAGEADGAAAAPFVARLTEAERQLAEVRAEIARLQNRIGQESDPAEGERDQLTSALNQSGARRVLEQLGRHDRDYVLLMFGVDDLMSINERFGRPVGDNVLNAFAATLAQTFPQQELIRWAGNEFVIVMTDVAAAAARVIADEALEAMHARRLKLRGSGAWIGIVTASAGIVVAHDSPVPLVLERAREKLTAAGIAGGNRVEG